MKEIIGIIVIVISICVTSFVLQTYLEKSSDELLTGLNNLKQIIKQEETSSANIKIKETSNYILNKWEETYKIWSMFVMHQELDNIKLSILEVTGAIEVNKKEDALEEIDKTIYLVGHIKEKEEFKLKNLF